MKLLQIVSKCDLEEKEPNDNIWNIKSYGLTDSKHFVNKEVLALRLYIIYNSFVWFNLLYYYDLVYSNSFFLYTAKVGPIRETIPKI